MENLRQWKDPGVKHREDPIPTLAYWNLEKPAGLEDVEEGSQSNLGQIAAYMDRDRSVVS